MPHTTGTTGGDATVGAPPPAPDTATADTADTAVSGSIVTVPNALSVLRLLGVPLFLWLVLGPHADGLALAVLMVAGFTDYIDGIIARRFGQITRLGQLLDPAADRLYIIATVVGLAVRGIIPVWLAVLLPLRDVLLAPTILVLRRHGYPPLPVHFLGKVATGALLYAFPLLLLGAGSSPLARAAHPLAWAFTIWGLGLYWWAGLLYAVQTRRVLQG